MNELQFDMAAIKPTMFSIMLFAVMLIVVTHTLRFFGAQWPQIPGSGLLRGL